MSYIITIIVFIVIFSVLILIHEFGHFIAAKRSGIKVEEFGIGLPPRIWGKKVGETIYSVNWIPFGGFVRMLGESGADEKMLKKKRSFVAQPMRTRAKVTVAGVFMNFVLAWLLISIGFTAGMQPLLTPDDVLPAVNEDVIELTEGVKIKEVNEGGLFDKAGFEAEDEIFSINGELVNGYLMEEIKEDPTAIYKVVREGEIFTYEIIEDQIPPDFEESGLGAVFYDYVAFPRVKVYDVARGSPTYKAGLRPGDIIISVNDHEVFSVPEYEQYVRGHSSLEYEIYRNGFRERFFVELDQSRRVIISSVIPDTPAENVGLEAGDIIISVNGNLIDDSLELIEFVEGHSDGALAYLIERDGERIFYEVMPQEGKIGVYLSELISYSGEQDMSIYNIDLISSILQIKEEKYPLYVSIYKSFGEGLRLTRLTGQMIGGFISDLVRKGEIPESVAGPVGIAQLTHVFVGEGFISVLRFVALLSISLAVINILPFPALDGGRLLFIIVELIIGRRVNQRWESAIHALGYTIILLLILAVTYGDIVRLFQN